MFEPTPEEDPYKALLELQAQRVPAPEAPAEDPYAKLLSLQSAKLRDSLKPGVSELLARRKGNLIDNLAASRRALQSTDLMTDFPEETREAAKEQLRISSSMGAGETPTVAAERLRIAKELGIPHETLRDPAQRARYAEIAKWTGVPVDELAGTKTGEWAAADPVNMALINGNFKPLQNFEDLSVAVMRARVAAKNMKEGKTGALGVLQGLGASLMSGAASLPEMSYTIQKTITSAVFGEKGAAAYEKIAPYINPMGYGAHKTVEKIEPYKRATESVLVKDDITGEESINWSAVNPFTAGGAENIANMIFGEAAPMAAQIGISAASAGTATPAVVGANAAKIGRLGKFAKAVWAYSKSPAAMFNNARVVQGFASQGVQELMAKGMTEDEAWAKVAPGALLSGLISAGAGSPMEAKVMEGLFTKVAVLPGTQSFMKKAASRMASFVAQGSKEGAQEVLEGIGEDLAAYITYAPDKSLKEFASNAIMNFAGGAAMGGLLGAGMHGSNAIAFAENRAFVQALGDPEFRKGWAETAPDKLAEFVEHVTKGGELEVLPVKADEFVQLFQSQGMTNEQIKSFVVDKLGVAPDNFDLATQNSGDLIIPTKNYAQHLGPREDFQEIYGMTRVDQDGPTFREAEVTYNNEQELTSLRDAVSKLKPNDPERDQVRDLIAAQLGLATRVLSAKETLGVADTYAKVLAVRAARDNKPLLQVYEKNKLTITKDFHAKLESLKGPDHAFNEDDRPEMGDGATDLQTSDARGAEQGLRGQDAGVPGVRSQEAESRLPGRESRTGQGVAPPPMLWHGTDKRPSSLKAEDLGNEQTAMGPGLHVSAGPDQAFKHAKGDPHGLWRVGIRSDFTPFDASTETSYSPEQAAEFGLTTSKDLKGSELWSYLVSELGSPAAVAEHLGAMGFDGVYYNYGGEDAWGVWKNDKLTGSRPTNMETAQEDYARQGSRRDDVTGELKVAQTSTVKGIAVKTGSFTRLDQSVRSWTGDLKKEIQKTNKKLGIVSEEDLSKWMDDVDSIASFIMNVMPELDYDPSEIHTSLKDNSDKFYKKSVDFSTICKKRIEFQATLEAIAVELWQREKATITVDDMVEIRNLMVAAGREVGCGACYVDSARLKAYSYLGEMATKYPEHADKFFTTAGWDFLKANEPEIYKALRGRFGALGGKGFESRTDYRGELLKMFGGKRGRKAVDDYNRRSGLRWQSWSDFELVHAIDAMQVAMDSAVVGLAGHAYTKVADFVALMGNTGLMINQSLIAPLKGGGLDSKGNLVFDHVEGMDSNIAFANREKFPNSVGTVLIGISDLHILRALADPRIDYVIPYHASGLGKERRTSMSMDWKDYTAQQNDRDYAHSTKVTAAEKAIWKKMLEDRGLTSGKFSKKKGKVGWEEHNGDIETYIKLAAERGLIPRFVNFIDNPNYMKLLTDKRQFNDKGERIKQGPLKAEFDVEVVKRMLSSYTPAPSSMTHKATVDQFFGRAVEEQEKIDLDNEDAGVVRMNQSVYHGSPYNFDRFTLDHMGEGEGAQAYGWGLYFAGNKGVAEWYRRKLTDSSTTPFTKDGKTISHIEALRLYFAPGRVVPAYSGKDEVAAFRETENGGWLVDVWGLRNDGTRMGVMRTHSTEPSGLDAFMKEAGWKKGEAGQLYKAEIPEDDTMLLWDSPVSKQSDVLKGLLGGSQNWDIMSGGKKLGEAYAKTQAEAVANWSELVRFKGDTASLSAVGSAHYTGEALYEELVAVHGSDEAASKYLRSLGISGIKYLDGTSRSKGEGNFNYVVFDDAAISILETYYQGKAEDSRGYLIFPKSRSGEERRLNLVLLESENKSTVFHELGHFYLELLSDMADDPTASASTQEDFATTLKWFGLTREQWAGMTGDQRRPYHEKFADAHLVYLSEGNAPSEELRASFTKYSGWLKRLGQKLLGVEVNMTDEVRGVFARLYATDEEIEASKRGITNKMFATAEQAGMSQAEFEVYSKAVEKEIVAAKEELLQRTMAELKRENQAEYREAKSQIESEVDVEIAQKPEYSALIRLSEGLLEDGVTPIKLSRQMLVAKYGKDLPAQLTRDTNFVYTTELPEPGNGVMDDDSAASLLGFRSGADLVDALTNLTPVKVLSEQMVSQRMQEKYPELIKDEEALKEAALDILNGERREAVLTSELRRLRNLQRKAQPAVNEAVAKLTKEQREAAKDRIALNAEQERAARAEETRAREAGVVPKVNAIRTVAKNFIMNQVPWQLRPQSFLTGQMRHGKEAFKQLAAKNYEAAAKAKEDELMAHFLYIESKKALAYAERFRKTTKANDSKTVRQNMGKAGGDYLQQFDSLRDRFSIEREPNAILAGKATLREWKAYLAGQAEDTVFEEWLMTDEVFNYRELTLRQLQDVGNALDNIKHLAYAQLGTIIDGKRVEYEQMWEDFEVAFTNNLTSDMGVMLASDARRTTKKFKAMKHLQGFDSVNVKIEQLVNWIDGNSVLGPAHRYIWNRIAKAQAADAALTLKINKPLLEAMEAMPKAQREALNDPTHTYEGILLTPVSRAQILTMLLYSGQETRRQKLLAGYAKYGLTEAKLNQAFTHLTQEDLAFAKTVWAAFDNLAPEIQSLEQRLTGVRPEWEGGREFEVYDHDGNLKAMMKGGYFPMVADPEVTGELGKRQEGGTVQQILGGNGYSRATTSTSHVKEVTGKVYPLLLDFHAILTRELTNQIKDLTHRETVLSVNKILSNDRFAELMKTHIGAAYEDQLMPWLTNIANDRNAGASRGMRTIDSFMNGLRSNAVAAVLGFKYSSVIVQFADISRVLAPGSYRVKAKHLASAYKQLLSDNKATVEMIKALSPEMTHRAHNLDRDLRARLDELTGDNSMTASWNRAAFSGLAMMDTIISWPTWLGRYQQGMAEHNDSERAALEADRTVTMLLQGGAPKDLTPLMAKKEWGYKLVTMFMGDATANYNKLRDAGHNISGLKGVGTFSGALLMVMMGAILGDILKGQWPEDEEDVAGWVARKAALAPFGTAPVVRDVANVADNVFAGKPFTDYKFSPAITTVQKAIVDPLINTRKVVSGDQELADYAINMLQSAGYALGVGGTAQATASTKYFKRYMDGEEDPSNPFQFTHDILRGKRKEQK